MICEWILTCICSPEQYDIVLPGQRNVIGCKYESGDPVAYFRLRHGRISVHPYGENNEIDFDTVIFSYQFANPMKGSFETDDERDGFMCVIENSIMDYVGIYRR